MENIAICITAGEQSENHVGMKINGSGIAKSGFTIEDLKHFQNILEKKNISCEYHRLDSIFEDKTNLDPAALLIIRNGVDHFINKTNNNMLLEQLKFEWDKKYWDTRRSKVLNKQARYNVCYGKKAEKPDYDNKKGTIIAYKDVPILNKWKNALGTFFGKKAMNLEIEGNLYYDTTKCGIGFHGDSERKKVIACSLGKSRPIHWQWYLQSKPIGRRFEFILNSGDMYIMSEKTTGYDWKRKKIKTLRHAAGERFTSKKDTDSDHDTHQKSSSFVSKKESKVKEDKSSSGSKRKPSGYNLFVKDQRVSIPEAAKKWKSLTDSERGKWNATANV